jgi:hypothetical protein
VEAILPTPGSLSTLLIGSTVAGHVVEAKRKTGKVTVALKNWNPNAPVIMTEDTEKTVG